MKSSNTRNKIIYVLSILSIVAIWAIMYKIENQDLIVPSIKSTIYAVMSIIQKPVFISGVLATIFKALIAFLIAFIAGIIVGILGGLSKKIETFLEPYILILKTLPFAAIVILIIIWFNTNSVPIVVSLMLCFPVVYENILNGMKNISKELLEFSTVHKIKLNKVLKYIYIPGIKGYILSAIDSTLLLTLKIVINAEILCSPKIGIGTMLYESKMYLETAEVFAWIIIILIISFVLDFLWRMCKKWILN